MTQFPDNLAIGAGYSPGATATTATIRRTALQVLGALVSPMVAVQYGQIATAVATGIALATSGSTTVTLNGTLVSGGVAVFATPRNVSITGTGNSSGRTIVVTGLDEYQQTMTERFTGPNNGTVAGVKAFKSVSSVVPSGALTGPVKFGTGVKIGFPYRVANAGAVCGVYVNGVAPLGTTLVSGFTATGTSTATTADVRGTWTATAAPNGSRYYTALIVPAPGSVEGTAANLTLYGAAQA